MAYVRGRLQIDGGNVISPTDGEYEDAYRWNGWAVPRFTPANARKAAAELAGQEFGAKEWREEPDGTIVVVNDERITDPGEERYAVEVDGYVHLGAMNWTWEVVGE